MKKILALVMAAAMLLALAACGGSADNTADNTAADSSAAADDVNSSPAAEELPTEEEEAPVEEAPAEQTPAGEPETEQEPAEETPAEPEPEAEQKPAEEPEAEPEQEDAPAGEPSAEEESAEEAPAENEGAEEGDAEGGRISAFYTGVIGKYELPMGLMEVCEPEMLDNYFPGLTAIETKESVIALTMMGPANGEIVAVEVSAGDDVAAVEKILNDRVAYMIESGAFYPETTEIWEKNSRVVSSGNFVLLVTSASCDAIVEDFLAAVQ